MDKYIAFDPQADAESYEVTVFSNEFGDEIELTVYQFPNEYYAVAVICQEEEPFKDFTGIGVDLRRKKTAIKKALIHLYEQAYENLFLMER